MIKNKLKEYREDKGWTQEQLAIISGVSRTTISNLENGKEVNVGVKTLDKLSKVFKVPTIAIFF